LDKTEYECDNCKKRFWYQREEEDIPSSERASCPLCGSIKLKVIEQKNIPEKRIKQESLTPQERYEHAIKKHERTPFQFNAIGAIIVVFLVATVLIISIVAIGSIQGNLQSALTSLTTILTTTTTHSSTTITQTPFTVMVNNQFFLEYGIGLVLLFGGAALVIIRIQNRRYD
jgi:DNA-directed RNA polymerase subunit RPC12/RpoP